MYKGNVVSVQIGPESAWGTEANATEVLNLSSVDLDLQMKKQEDDSIIGNISTVGKDVTGRSASGSVSGKLKPDNAMSFFKYAFGKKTSVVTATPGVYKHTYLPVGPNETLPSFTAEVNKGASSKIYLGCKLASLSLSAKSQGYVEYNASIKAKDEITGTMTAGLNKPTKRLYLASGASFTIGGNDVAGLVDSFTFEPNNNVDDGVYTFGSGMSPLEMTQGLREYKVSFEGFYDTALETVRETYFKTGEVVPITLTFMSPTEIGSTGEFERFTITVPNCTIDEAKINISGTDYIKVSFSGVGTQVGTTTPAQIELFNGVAS